MGDILTMEGYAAGNRAFQTGNAVNQLRLSVSVDTGDTDDLPCPDGEGDIVHGVLLAELGGHSEVLHLQNHIPGVAFLLLDGKLHIPSHHHPGQVRLGAVLHIHSADVLALAQHGAAVSHGGNLVELMGDEEDGLALCRQIAHDLQQLLNFLRGQHGGGLVKNQDFIVPVQHLQDFGTLLHTHGDILHQCIGVDLQAVLLGQSHNLFPCLVPLEEAVFGVLHTQNDVVQHREALHQLKVLVHHADAQGVGIIGVVDGDNFPILPDKALLRLIQAEQDAHQRGLTGAVFPQQGVDFTPAQLQGHIVVGDNSRESLGNVHHFNGVFRVAQANYLLFHKL